MVDPAQREILKMIEAGELSAPEGLRLLNAMQPDDVREDEGKADDVITADEDTDISDSRIASDDYLRMQAVKRWWLLPFILGMVLLLSGAGWMYDRLRADNLGWGFWIAWLPFVAGVIIIALSARARHAIWIHLRVSQRDDGPNRLRISFPLPVKFAGWFLRKFGARIRGLNPEALMQIEDVLQTISPTEPFYLRVEEPDEDIEIFIG